MPVHTGERSDKTIDVKSDFAGIANEVTQKTRLFFLACRLFAGDSRLF
jgi:hypothetical protein